MHALKRAIHSPSQPYARMRYQEVLDSLQTTVAGLSHHEVVRRLQQYGHNVLVVRKKQPLLLEYLNHFRNPLIITLMAVALISGLLGQTIDAMIVMCMVFLSTTLDFFQEHKATHEAEKLMEKVATIASVLRDGSEVQIPAQNLVPGDVVILNAGDIIPADARIIEAKDCFVNQSALTGESFPVRKSDTEQSEKQSNSKELHNMVFLGTSVITGTCKAVIVQTGSKTMFGQIATTMNDTTQENDFTRGMQAFSKFIVSIIIVFVLFIFGVNALLKQDIMQALLFSIAIAVGLTPEFLPMIMSVTMAQGASAMEKKGVIVKKLTAIPSFGSMDILCTDKTGTLTKDKIALVRCVDVEEHNAEDVFHYTYLNSVFQKGITNPMDEAVQAFQKVDIGSYTKLDEIPFDFERKRMSVVVRQNEETILITKGAPETVIETSSHFVLKGKMHVLTESTRKQCNDLYHKLSADGFRVLAVAKKSLTKTEGPYTKHEENDLELLGFTAFLDPAKPNVKQSIDTLEGLGIEVKVITGDNELVTRKICEESDIPVKGYMLGSEMDHMSEEELAKKVEENSIFARFSPIQKNRVIAALQKNGHVVGYMGDGINDAPSLKTADVGISVVNAVPVAKESADLILTHKSLDVLGDGVREGRKTFGNTMKYILMGLSSNFGNMFSLLGAIIFLPYLPMLPIQILLNNFLYDFSQIVLPTDHVDDDYVKSPKRWNMTDIKHIMMVFGPLSSIFDFLTFYLLYQLFPHNPEAFRTGWFIESLATQVFVIYVIRTRKIPFLQSSPSPILLTTTILVVATGWLIPFTPLGAYFGFTQLPGMILLLLAAITITYLILAEVAKHFYFHLIPGVKTAL